MSADRLLYELSGRDDRRFSPFCWRIRMALAHKGLDARYEPVRFIEKDKLAFANTLQVPVLVDFGEVVVDSWAIAKYLDDNYYQERPLMMGGGTRFLNQWVDTQLHPAISRVLIGDIYDNIDPIDQDYFRESREKRFGKPIEVVHAEREQHDHELKRLLALPRELLRTQPYLSGKSPSYADYIVFGALQWARSISPYNFLDDADPLAQWRVRMRKLYGSLADSVPTFY
jgi:glutathione S-transferase